MPDSGSLSAVPRRRRWLLFMPFALVVVLAAGWSVVWFYAAARAEPELAAWREAERRAGRTQDCASQSIGGYPFRIEVRCGGAGLELKGTPTLQLKLPFAAVAVQVYDPKLLIAEFTGPLEVSEPERARSLSSIGISDRRACAVCPPAWSARRWYLSARAFACRA